MNDEDLLRSMLQEHADGVDAPVEAGQLTARLERADRNSMLAKIGAGVAAAAVVLAVGLGAVSRGSERSSELDTAGSTAPSSTAAPTTATTALPGTSTVPGPGEGSLPTDTTVPGAGAEPAPSSAGPSSSSTSTTEPGSQTPTVSQPKTSNPQPTTPSTKSSTPGVPTTGCASNISPSSGSSNPFTINVSGHVNQGNVKVMVAIATPNPGQTIISTKELQADSSGNFSGAIEASSTRTGAFTVKFAGGGCNQMPKTYTKG